MDRGFFRQLRDFYRRHLREEVLPFWERYAIGEQKALYTCIADDGTVQSRDLWNWSQWRAVWVFSKLYHSIERRPEWLNIARGIYGFVTHHGPLENGHWPLLLDGDGNVLKGFDSIYVDGFAIYGLVEYWRATGEEKALRLAEQTFHAVQNTLRSDTPPPAFPYPIPGGRRAHSISMLFSFVFFELAVATGNQEHWDAALEHHRWVFERFYRRDLDLVVEWTDLEGEPLPPPEGTLVIPGHAIESMWFQIHITRYRQDETVIQQACHLIQRHLETGWDNEYGGLYWAIDACGAANVAWNNPTAKLWWPHTEALYATLSAYALTEDPIFVEWHQRVKDYSFSHYPVPQYGEWRQKLDRRGEPLTESVALPVKDPFHLPRALIYCIDILNRLCDAVHKTDRQRNTVDSSH